MIARLRGIVVEKTATMAIIECGGVGYGVMTSVATSDKIPSAGSETTLYTLLIPREDELQLFGFATIAERDVFTMLTSIPGIGTKTALGILSAISLGELRSYVLSNNLSALQKLPGIGKKTAERLLVEMRDRAVKIVAGEETTAPSAKLNLMQQDAVSALIALGFARLIAEKAVKRAVTDPDATQLSADILIKRALKYAAQ
ncbi:Holliday junction branch migration protein RuvA [Ignavibacteria bacterium]|nr:Holliday junction branch migration protein RuvA [Bacteroidota bacterium]MCZ2133485.1 Holliday junction branch migration protein RuvA [Bacteroidota bacterium]